MNAMLQIRTTKEVLNKFKSAAAAQGLTYAEYLVYLSAFRDSTLLLDPIDDFCNRKVQQYRESLKSQAEGTSERNILKGGDS
jgi:hypothetical protein